jgi:phage terminase Nu1 subunit (DNA packaging protein)
MAKRSKRESGSKAEQFAGSQAELARILGVGRRTVTEWVRHRLWLFGRTGPYPVAAIGEWRARVLHQAQPREVNGKARERIDEERAEILRLRRQQLEGTLVPKDAVEKTVAALTAVYVAELEALPQRLCRPLAGLDVAEVRDGLREAVGGVRDRLTERMEHG